VDDWPTSPSEINFSHTPGWRSQIRWWTHLTLLTLYPLILGVAGGLSRTDSDQPLLPTDTVTLLFAMGFELMSFVVVFALAWWFSRVTTRQLLLSWSGGVKPLVRGFFYSIALRGGLMLLLFVIFAATGTTKDVVDQLRPNTEGVVNAHSLLSNPVYLLLNLTLVSFVVGGLREELWRAGMLAGLAALFPRQFDDSRGQLLPITLVAIVFGLGHLPQGWGGVVMTACLGFGLGRIMLRSQSIWEAVFAHGFFDASTFGMLYLFARFWPDLLGK